MKKKNKIIIVILLVTVILAALIYIYLIKNKVTLSHTHTVNTIASLEGNNQTEIEKQILDNLFTGQNKMADAIIYLDPYLSSPLTALITYIGEENETIRVTVKGRNSDDLITSYKTDEKYHFIPVYGLYEDFDNTVIIENEKGDKQEYKIKTQKIEKAPSTNIEKSDVEKLKTDDIYIITSPISMNTFGIDKYGYIRWYTNSFYYHDFKLLDNGHFMIGASDINKDGLCTKILEMDYLGRIYSEYSIEEGYLNDFFLKENNNIIVASKNPDRKTMSDYIIEIDSQSGKIVKKIDIYELFNDIDPVFVNGIQNSDYFYNSGIKYYPESNELLLTYWGGEFVLNLNYETGKINYIFSNPLNFSNNFQPYLLKTSDNFVYPKGMHAASKNVNILKVLDNGYSTNKGETNTSNLIGSYSSANTYKIDDKSIELVNSYDNNKEYFSYAIGDYEIVDDTDEIVLYGRELTGLDYSLGININDYDYTTSKLIEYIDGENVLTMSIDIASYSISKINMTKNINYSWSDIQKYTTLEVSPKEELTNEIIKSLNDTTLTIGYEFDCSNKTISNNVSFMDSDEAQMVLIDEENKGAMYTLKEKDKAKVNKIVTDLANGKYYIYVLENGHVYKTNSFIELN